MIEEVKALSGPDMGAAFVCEPLYFSDCIRRVSIVVYEFDGIEA